MLIHEIIERNAKKTPGAVAISDGHGRRETWRAFDDSITALAGRLRRLGVGPGDRVGMLADNRIEVYHTFLAASRLGAAFSPVNYRFAPPEVVAVLENSQPRVMIVEPRYFPVAKAVQQKTARLDTKWLSLGEQDPELPALDDVEPAVDQEWPRGDEEDIALICYTGGSTGRAKGVMLSHRTILANATNTIVHDQIVPWDVYLAAGALFHIGIVVPFAYWQVGARCVTMNFQPAAALALAEQEGITKLIASGTIFKMLIDEMEAHPRSVCIRRIDAGGAPVPTNLVKKARELFGCAVGQIYGQTEVCLTGSYLYPEEYSAGLSDAAGETERARAESVGRAAAVSIVQIVDPQRPDLTFLDAGTVGEIVIAGPNVMSGYWLQPDLTAATLVDGWARTGDLGRLDDDGYLYLSGRKRDLIITGGENVYANEVELVLLEHPAIDEVVVIGVPDEHWGERVHAVALARLGVEVDAEDIRAFCRERMAGYKVPKTIEFRESLPRLTSNKIARGEIRSEFWAAP